MARPLAAMLASSVEQSPDGMIGVLGGGITVLHVERLPSTVERLGVLVAIEGDGQLSEQHRVQIELRDPLGNDVLALMGEASLQRPEIAPVEINWLAITLPPLPLAIPGRYQLSLSVDGAELKLPISVEGALMVAQDDQAGRLN